jgi:hypothetical protein
MRNIREVESGLLLGLAEVTFRLVSWKKLHKILNSAGVSTPTGPKLVQPASSRLILDQPV